MTNLESFRTFDYRDVIVPLLSNMSGLESSLAIEALKEDSPSASNFLGASDEAPFLII
jgi:hypothetical protein